jgi:hypothetical protein
MFEEKISKNNGIGLKIHSGTWADSSVLIPVLRNNIGD